MQRKKFHLHMKHNAKTSPSDRDKGSTRVKHVHGNESKGNNLVCEDDEVVPANTLSKLLTLEEGLESDAMAASEGKQNKKGKQPLLSFVDKKKKGWNNLKAKIRFSEVRRKVSSWRSVGILSKVLVIRLKLKMVRSIIKRKVRKQSKHDLEQNGDENGEEDKGRELCKKRILMGVRCKPLSSSGTLRYDEDGIFLPEITSFTSTPSHHP
ncbi:hypothetical protein TanjilG_02733 [Lupinus angustifolius]|uniref:Uncharacterized protein n=2 Tax=Lupinus angustifolius TaxID=3871 RepID=A0A4P1RBR0_LUPAN|nr:hypothetical protein TanjilG_02733 [Lupinus angustifolius]